MKITLKVDYYKKKYGPVPVIFRGGPGVRIHQIPDIFYILYLPLVSINSAFRWYGVTIYYQFMTPSLDMIYGVKSVF